VPSLRFVPKARLSGARLLVVEDNDINQQVARELLEYEGATVTVAGGGQAALDILARSGAGAFDVVLMDLQMPDMDGFQTTKQIRAQAAFGKLPIVAMTADVMGTVRADCLSCGMNDYTTKPITIDRVVSILAPFVTPAPRSSSTRPSTTSVPHRSTAPLIDVPEALRRLGGREQLYRRLLAQFATRYEGPPLQLRASLAAGDTTSAVMNLHTLKGVAGNLGATALRQASADLEELLRSHPTDLPDLSPFERLLEATVNAAKQEAA
jgi:CheY-like chemotaxis protein